MSASFFASRKPDSSAKFFFEAIFIVFCFTSCVTAPPAPAFSVPAWVSSGQTVVLRVDATQVEAFSALSKEFPALTPALARTQVVWLSWSPKNSVRIALDGDFPPLVTAWILFWNRPPLPWVVTQPTKGVVIAQASNPDFSPGYSSEDGKFWPEGALRVVVSDPVNLVLGDSVGKLLPAKRIVVSLENQDSTLRGEVQLEMPDSRSAAMGLILLKLGKDFINEKLGQNLTWRAEGELLVGEPFILLQADLLPWVYQRLSLLQKTPKETR